MSTERATTCPGCACVKAALSEVGMDPERVFCGQVDGTVCAIGCGCGYGTEGLPLDEVERLVDKAIAVCTSADNGSSPTPEANP
jgi:hypothetical protein